MRLEDRYRGCLLGLAAGDAVGSAAEARERGAFTPLTGMAGGGLLGRTPGQWTDETGLALWTLWEHAVFVDDPAAKRDYLQAMFPAIQRGADLLVACRDATNGMPCAASEDDSVDPTQTLHGATAVYTGLVSAAQAARALGGHDAQAATWEARAAEVKAAIATFFDASANHFTNEGWRGGEWVIFPAMLLPLDDPRVAAQAQYIRNVKVLPNLAMQTQGFAYLTESILAMAVAAREDPARMAELKDWMGTLLDTLPTKGTGHLGEVTLTGDFDGDGKKEFVNVTSIPHVWEATTLALALIATYHPEALDRVMPDWPAPPAPASGCGATAAGPLPPSLLLLAVAAWVLRLHRRPRRA